MGIFRGEWALGWMVMDDLVLLMLGVFVDVS
jgi:hypothetical protein